MSDAALRERVLSRIRPSAQEREMMLKTVKHIEQKLERHIPDGVRTLLAGSIAKGTFLHGEGDIDLFLLSRKHSTRRPWASLSWMRQGRNSGNAK